MVFDHDQNSKCNWVYMIYNIIISYSNNKLSSLNQSVMMGKINRNMKRGKLYGLTQNYK